MDQKKCESLFRKIIKQKHGMEVDFERIEERLHHLKDGDPLTYDDCNRIMLLSIWWANGKLLDSNVLVDSCEIWKVTGGAKKPSV